jgi:hypothetical protein
MRGRDQSEVRRPPISNNWLRGLRLYLSVILLGNLAWEILQLPLYTIWSTGTFREIAFAVVHCTGGDVLIALTALTVALITAGSKDWPVDRFHPVMLATVSLGVSYTIFSEWLNIVVRASWAYSPVMPIVPGINTGLSPLLQWIVIPAVALWLAQRAALSHRA